jgi:primosomal protein N' (replication factor Y)
MAAIARVEPLTTARALRGPFDYRIPEELAGVGEGTLLVVPFGGRRVLGVVLELAEDSELAPERLAAPLRALELGVPSELVRLALWVADAYCSTPARALALVLPPGAGSRTTPRVRERTGLVAQVTEAGRCAGPAPGAGPRLTDRQRALLARLADAGPLRAAAAGADHGTLRRLERRGLLALERRVLPRRPDDGPAVGARRPQPPVLTAAQADAVAALEAALADPAAPSADRRFLLHGVTGSGKTEVYLRAAAAALEAGRGVIVLVPEIALTPQTVARFRERFGETVAVLHSGLRAGERHDEWLRLRRGEARVCVGPRSAVFAPVRELGLVVVDEEHEAAYKHEGDPRYDARAVAERRAASAGAVLVAGSATPRPESRRRLARLRLDRRADGRPLPPVALVDMREAPHALHPATREALEEVRRRGEKAIVLLNRRGWSNFLSCRSWGTRGPARTATSRSSCTARRVSSPATTVAIAGPRRVAATPAARSRWRATGPAPSASSTSSRRRWPARTSPCCASTPTPPPGAARPLPCWRASRTRPAACSWGPRWSPRATTSPT